MGKTKRGYYLTAWEIKGIEFDVDVSCIGRLSNHGIGDYEFWGVPETEIISETELDSFAICEIKVKGQDVTNKVKKKCPNIYKTLLDLVDNELDDIGKITWIEDYY
jgi:hypothetical protein